MNSATCCSTVVNIARYLSLDSDSALKKTNRKFKRRFQWMESQLRAQGKQLESTSLDELETSGSRRNLLRVVTREL